MKHITLITLITLLLIFAPQLLTAQMEEIDEKALLEIIKEHEEQRIVYQDAWHQLIDSYEERGEPQKVMELFEDRIGKAGKDQAGSYMFLNRRLEELMRGNQDLKAGQKKQSSRSIDESRALAKRVLQRDNNSVREKALDEIAGMLDESTTDDQKLFALRALNQTAQAKYDRKPFQPLVLPLIESPNEDVRALTVRICGMLEFSSKVIPAIADMVDDPEPMVRKEICRTLKFIDEGKSPGLVIPVLMELLTDHHPDVVERTVKSLWGDYTSPEFDELLVELSEDSRIGGDVLYFCISPINTKSVTICTRMTEYLDDPDWNRRYRAAWGLTYGVVDEARSLVENAVLTALPEETDPQTRKRLFQVLETYGSQASLDYLRKVYQSKMETDETRERAGKIIDSIQAATD